MRIHQLKENISGFFINKVKTKSVSPYTDVEEGPKPQKINLTEELKTIIKQKIEQIYFEINTQFTVELTSLTKHLEHSQGLPRANFTNEIEKTIYLDKCLKREIPSSVPECYKEMHSDYEKKKEKLLLLQTLIKDLNVFATEIFEEYARDPHLATQGFQANSVKIKTDDEKYKVILNFAKQIKSRIRLKIFHLFQNEYEHLKDIIRNNNGFATEMQKEGLEYISKYLQGREGKAPQGYENLEKNHLLLKSLSNTLEEIFEGQLDDYHKVKTRERQNSVQVEDVNISRKYSLINCELIPSLDLTSPLSATLSGDETDPKSQSEPSFDLLPSPTKISTDETQKKISEIETALNRDEQIFARQISESQLKILENDSSDVESIQYIRFWSGSGGSKPPTTPPKFQPLEERIFTLKKQLEELKLPSGKDEIKT